MHGHARIPCDNNNCIQAELGDGGVLAAKAKLCLRIDYPVPHCTIDAYSMTRGCWLRRRRTGTPASRTTSATSASRAG